MVLTLPLGGVMLAQESDVNPAAQSNTEALGEIEAALTEEALPMAIGPAAKAGAAPPTPSDGAS